jgi:ABC-2 type transport system ATP-binding protein
MIEIDGLTKRYGDKTAVDRLSFVVEPGVVTGFLGPNGAGKSTTMRVIAGLDRPTSGTVRVNGKHYPEAAAPMSELGILLDARSVHPGLSARNNLLALARTAGIGRRRVDEVIELAGLAEVAGTRAGGFSLGMGQRLGVAAALLGQPQTVVLDEPVNGLDPDGVRWIRLLLKSLAEEGRTVFVSSHLMSEMAQTATRLVVLGRGKLISETSVEDFVDHAAAGVLVRTPETERLGQVLAAPGVTVITFDLDDYVYAGLRAGASGFLLKDTQPASLVAAIHTIAAGDAVLAPTATTRLVHQFAVSPRPGSPSSHPAAQLRQALTSREQDVFSRIAAGMSNSEIAASLFLSEGTVKIHVGRILAKLGLRDRVQAVVLAYESGLITPGTPPPDGPG